MSKLRLEGRVTIRPIRVALVDAFTSHASLSKLANHAASHWGGVFYFALPSSDPGEIASFAVRHSVDVVTFLDGEREPPQGHFPGFEFRSFGGGGPFGEGDGSLAPNVLRSDALLERDAVPSRAAPSRPIVGWPATHPCSTLFECMFGRRGVDPHSQDPSDSEEETRWKTVLDDTEGLSAVAFGAEEYHRTTLGMQPPVPNVCGVVCIDPADPLQLVGYWNLRALGFDVVPWTLDNPEWTRNYVRAWLSLSLRNLGPSLPTLNVWLPDTMNSLPQTLEQEINATRLQGAPPPIALQPLTAIPDEPFNFGW